MLGGILPMYCIGGGPPYGIWGMPGGIPGGMPDGDMPGGIPEGMPGGGIPMPGGGPGG